MTGGTEVQNPTHISFTKSQKGKVPGMYRHGRGTR